MKPVLLILLASLFIVNCSNDTPVAGPSTELDNPAYAAVVLDSLKTPSANANVSIFKFININNVTDNLDTIVIEINTLRTDIKGFFKLDNLSSGEYLIKSTSQDSLQTALKRLIIKDNMSTTLHDTLILGNPGAIKGVVSRASLSNQGNSNVLDGDIRLVIVELNQDLITGPKGEFNFRNIPEGVYTLAVYPGENFYSQLKKQIVVLTGKTTTLDTIRLERIPWVRPPKPNNLICIYDTASSSVILKWNKVSVENLRGYIIEKRLSESILTPVEIFVTDTFYEESLASYQRDTHLFYSVKSYTIQFEKSYTEGPVEIIVSQ